MKKSENVFKKSGLFLLLALALLLLVRCEKEPLIVIPTQYAIDASTGPGGTLLPKVGQILVEKGKNQVVTPKPDDGNEVETMIVDGDDVTKLLVNNTYTFTTVVSGHTVFTTFKKIVVIMHKVEILPTTGGYVNSLTQVADGLGIDFTFVSDPGFKPDSVIVNGKSFPLTGNTYSLTNITSDTKVKGVFTKTNLWYLIQGPWKMSKLEERQINTTEWYNHSFSYEKTLFVLMTYDAQYRVKVINPQGFVVGDVPYTITADSLIWGQPMGQYRADGIRNKIIQLDDNTLELLYVSKFYDIETGIYVPSHNIEVQATYTH